MSSQPTYQIITPGDWNEIVKREKIESPKINNALINLYKNTTIYERLDNLIDLYLACKSLDPSHTEVTKLMNQAANFIEIIGNSKDIEDTIKQRLTMNKSWGNFLPNTSLSHVTPFKESQNRKDKIIQRITDHVIALGKGKLLDVNETDKKQDKLFGVKMLSPLEKENYRVIPCGGTLWQLKQPIDTETALSMQAFDTTELNAHHGKKGRAIFVLSPQGEIFAGSSEMGEFHHSSFQSGGYVAYGGTFAVKEGRLDYIDDYSGHYTPKAQQFFNVLKEFKKNNLIHEDTIINKSFDESMGLKVGSTYLNTRGFLGLKGPSVSSDKPKQDIDHYQTIQLHLFNTIEEEKHPMWQVFAVVMSVHLSMIADKTETITQHIGEISEFMKELGIDSDFVEKHPNKYQEAVEVFNQYLDSNKGLMSDLGGDRSWLNTSQKKETELKVGL